MTEPLLMSQFISQAAKPGGTRWGAIGAFGETQYLIKREIGGYPDEIASTPNSVMFYETLCCDIIRRVLGHTFAAETRPLKIDCDSIQIHDKGGTLIDDDSLKRHRNNQNSNYGIASRLFNNKKTREKPRKSLVQEDTIKLNIMLHLLNINDIKPEHFIRHTESNAWRMAYIDCAGDFSSYSKLKLSDLTQYYYCHESFVGLIPSGKSLDSSGMHVLKQVLETFSILDCDDILQKNSCIPISKECSVATRNNLKGLIDTIKTQWLPKLNELLENKNDECSIPQESILGDRASFWYNLPGAKEIALQSAVQSSPLVTIDTTAAAFESPKP